jgi:paraquat-inducible protein A
VSAPAISAARASLVRCPGCEKLYPAEHTPAGVPCGRCGAAVHARKPASVQRTWALVLGAALLYVPSNLYPVMTISQFGQDESDTIISGVIALFQAGWYPVAVAILFASILVPCVKIISLVILLLALQRGSSWNPVTRTKMYRIVENIGRWSMLDMFTTSLLVALVQLGDVMSIEPGVGAICFAGVVVLTMLAAMSFDPRLVWDSLEEET